MNLDLRDDFFMAMSKYKKMESAFAAECKIPLNELAVLKRIVGGCKYGSNNSTNLDVPEIIERLQITKPAISYILNTLEKKGYITREIDMKDRRKVSVTATMEGKLAVEQFSAKLDDKWDSLQSNLGDEQMRQLVQCLTNLTNLGEEIWGEGKNTI